MTRRSRPRAVAWILSLATTSGTLLPSVAASQVIAVTTCGQTVSGSAVLTADLDCSAYSAGPAIVIDDGSLDLAGFRVVGSPTLTTPPGTYFDAVVYCVTKRTCTITGPGEISGGVNGISANRLELSGVTVTGNLRNGIRGYSSYSNAGRPINPSKVLIDNATITANGDDGISAHRCTITNATVADNSRAGIYCGKNLKLEASNVTSNAGAGVVVDSGIGRAHATIKETTISMNGQSGIAAVTAVIKLLNSTVSDNGGAGVGGLYIEKADVIDTSITGNGNFGWLNAGNLLSQSVYGRTRFTRSVIESNCVAPPTSNCKDIHSCGENATLVDTTCGTSSGCDGNSLGICSQD